MSRDTIVSEKPLYWALAVVVLSFVSSTLYTQHRSNRIHDEALEISGHAAPSIEHLAAVRAEMHRLESLVTRYIEDDQNPEELSQVLESEQVLDQAFRQYVASPDRPEELAFQRTIAMSLAELRTAAARAVSLAREGHLSEAKDVIERRLRPSVDNARASLMSDIDLNAQYANASARVIERIRSTSMVLAFTLDGISLAFAVLCAYIGGRLIRRYARLLEAHSALQEQRAREMEEFAGRVAHDIISPLTPVSLSLELLDRTLAKDGRAQELLARGRSGLARAKVIIDGLLTFARGGAQPVAGAVARVDEVIDTLLEELQPQAVEARTSLTKQVEGPCEVSCELGVLTSVVQNLVRNSIKYMGDSETRQVVVRAQPRGAVVRVEVEDTGPGLPPGLEARVFQPYLRGSTTGQPGIGLGLATVKRIVEAHAGRVGVERAASGGCLFWFELPSAAAPKRGWVQATGTAS